MFHFPSIALGKGPTVTLKRELHFIVLTSDEAGNSGSNDEEGRITMNIDCQKARGLLPGSQLARSNIIPP